MIDDVIVETVTYSGTTTTVTCPGQTAFTLPRWTGPPNATNYTQDRIYQISPVKPRVSYAADNRSLLVSETELSDEGLYRCYKTKPSFIGVNNVTVRILSAEPNITTSVTIDTNGLRATEGQSLTVWCTSRGGYPAPTVVWYNGSIDCDELARTSTGTKVGDTYTVTLSYTFTPSRQDNRQQLVCRSYYPIPADAQGSQQKNVTLYLYFPVEKSTSSIAGNAKIEANGVNPLSLTCTTGSSNPASNITWRNGSDVISNNNSYTSTSGTDNGIVRAQVLTLRPTRYDDGDTISCSVSNGILQVTDTTSTVLNLQYSPVIADMSDINIIEGDRATLKCNASSKPVASFTWKKGSVTVAQGPGTTSYNGYDYTISTVNRTQAGIYTCTAINQLSQTDSKQTNLTVLYPPDITVVGVDTTVNSQSTTVTCKASGVPDHFTYGRWVHTWHGQIVTHPALLPSTRVLTLTDLSYTHSGVYTCEASNGIKGVSSGSGSLLVKSFPVIVGEASKTKEIKSPGQLKHPITAFLQYYSNAGHGSVEVYRTNPSRQKVGELSYRNVTVKIPVFLSQITTPGTEAIISITVEEESHFGTYEVHVTNEIDTVILTLVIQPLGPPQPPFDMIIVLVHQSVDVTWKSGFPNGLNQTFIIQLSTDNSTWRNVSQHGGLSFQQTHEKRVSGLAGGQLYYTRMLSLNAKGESSPTRIITFTTERIPENDAAGSSSGAAIGGAVGGTLVAVVVVAVIVFIIWRRKGETRATGSATGSSSDTTQNYEAPNTTDDQRLYAQLEMNQTSTKPHTYENYGLSPYENLRGNQNNEAVPYAMVRLQGSKRPVYENI